MKKEEMTEASASLVSETYVLQINDLNKSVAGEEVVGESFESRLDAEEVGELFEEDGNSEEISQEGAEEIKKNEKNYSEEGFWKKVTKYAKKAGEKTLSPALKLHYSAQDADTPVWAKTTMYGALGYFISPVDGIPDITPALGYTDDIGILVGAVGVVAAHIKDAHTEKAMETLRRWFS